MTERTPESRKFLAIAAMAENRVIGNGLAIPWHLPEDFKWFKQKTMGHDLIMGRRTFESIGRVLPGRRTIVLSRGGFEHPDVLTCSSLENVPVPVPGRNQFICGVGEIYRMALPCCSDLFLTKVKREVEGDCFFPPFETNFRQVAVLEDNADFAIVHYERLPNGGS